MICITCMFRLYVVVQVKIVTEDSVTLLKNENDLGKVSKIKCVLFVENSTKGGEGVRPFYKS